MKIEFIKKHKMLIVFIGVGILLLIFSFALPIGESFFRKPKYELDFYRRQYARVAEFLAPLPIVIVAVDDKTSTGQRKENVAPQGRASASSEYSPQYGADKAIDRIRGQPDIGEWAANGGEPEGMRPSIQISWNAPKIIESVALWDRPNPTDHVTEGQLLFSDGSTMRTGALQNDGSSPLIIEFPEKRVTWVRFQVIATSTDPRTLNPGLSEIEVFSPSPSMSLFSETSIEVEQYCQDVANSGYIVILHPGKEQNPQDLREYLKDWWVNTRLIQNPPDKIFIPASETIEGLVQSRRVGKLEGAVFIGDLPLAYWRHQDTPCDFYFMDLEGWEWNLPANGIIRDFVLTGNRDDIPNILKPEIWVSRIPADTNLVKQFLSKNHQLRELGIGVSEDRGPGLPKPRALYYADDKYSFYENPGLRYLFNEDHIAEIKSSLGLGTRGGIRPTMGDYFLDSINSTYLSDRFSKCILLDLAAGGSPDSISFTDRYVNDGGAIDVQRIKDSQPRPVYYILRGGGFCNFLRPGYIASGFLFGENSHGEVCLGQTTYGRIIDQSFDPFYYALRPRNANFGRAYLHWLKTAFNSSVFTKKNVLECALLGDATLKIFAKDDVPLTNATEFVKKGITEKSRSEGASSSDLYIEDIWAVNYFDYTNIFFKFVYNHPGVVSVEVSPEGFLTANSVSMPNSTPVSYTVDVDGRYWKGAALYKRWTHHNIIAVTRPMRTNLDRDHRIRVLIDSGNHVRETDEGNNALEETIYTGEHVKDLLVRRVGFYLTNKFVRDRAGVWTNKKLRLWVKIENSGGWPTLRESESTSLDITIGGESHRVPIEVDWEAMSTNNPDGGIIYTMGPYLVLSYYPNIMHTLPNSSHDFEVTIDPENTISEQWEDNNTLRGSIRVPF